MMSGPPASSARFLFPGFGIVIIGILVALATDVALSQLTPAKFAFLLGGFVLLIPTIVMEHPKAYWLFLLVLSVPFDISKWLSAWLVEPQTLVDLYGQPASGTTAIEVYVTDVVLVAMVLPWLARVAVRQERVYFPAIGYLFVFYLAWALLVSVINAESFYLSLFELCRQSLYFLSFVYLVNNLTTRLQLRTAVWAMFLGFIIGAGTVIVFFELGYGTDASIFSGLRDQSSTSSQVGKKKSPDSQVLTLQNENQGRGLGKGGAVTSGIKRSQGMFRHPAIPAGLCGLILPIVLAYLIAARNNGHRIIFFFVLLVGITSLVLTFSRAGAIGLAAGILVFLAVGGWSGLIPRRVLVPSVVALALVITVSIPALLIYFGARPETFYMRLNLFEAALQGYSQHPILGVGLNNATGAMKAGRQEMKDMGIQMPPTESADSLYLVVLTEVGPLGFILFFLFIGRLVMIALRAMRAPGLEAMREAGVLKPLLVGIVGGLGSLAIQNLADDTLGGHAISATLWLFAALIIAAARYIQTETRSSSLTSSVGGHAVSIDR
jgi:hypothetical protein